MDKEIPKNKRQITNKFQIPKRQIPKLSAHWRDKFQNKITITKSWIVFCRGFVWNLRIENWNLFGI
jgi:hypothetical protein